MKGTKAQRLLEDKKRRLESQITAADKVLAEMPAEVRAELARILGPIFRATPKFDRSYLGSLTQDQRKILGVFYKVVYDRAIDRYQLEETKLLLNPPKGRPPKDNPEVTAAANEYLNPHGHRLSYKQLAIKHGRAKGSTDITRMADLIRKKVKKTRASSPHNFSGRGPTRK